MFHSALLAVALQPAPPAPSFEPPARLHSVEGEVFITPDGRIAQNLRSEFDAQAARRAYEQHYRTLANSRTRSEYDPIEVPEPDDAQQWQPYAEATHRDLTRIAATYWNLSPERIDMMQQAADQPDTYQSGLSNGYNQQWSHAYMLASKATWMWGDADEDCHDNLNGYGGGAQGHQGYLEKSAADYYRAGDQRTGDWYVGYASHYMADVSLVLHASMPSLTRMDLLTKHFAMEDWLKANANAGHRLLDPVVSDPHYYPITNPKTAVNSAAWSICYWNTSSGLGKRVWDAYRASGYPTGVGT